VVGAELRNHGDKLLAADDPVTVRSCLHQDLDRPELVDELPAYSMAFRRVLKVLFGVLASQL
jgi:hypothetical protein